MVPSSRVFMIGVVTVYWSLSVGAIIDAQVQVRNTPEDPFAWVGAGVLAAPWSFIGAFLSIFMEESLGVAKPITDATFVGSMIVGIIANGLILIWLERRWYRSMRAKYDKPQ
jgi:hypothetical protein